MLKNGVYPRRGLSFGLNLQRRVRCRGRPVLVGSPEGAGAALRGLCGGARAGAEEILETASRYHGQPPLQGSGRQNQVHKRGPFYLPQNGLVGSLHQ